MQGADICCGFGGRFSMDYPVPARLAERRKTAFADYADPQAAMKAGAAIRARALDNLPRLLETFEKNATEAGAHIHWAQDAVEANACIVKIAKENNISHVAKGKSMGDLLFPQPECHGQSCFQWQG